MDALFTKPFRALIYNKEKIDDISTCVCPPYDIITDRDIYFRKNPYNAVRLELPEAIPPFDEYTTARNTLHKWLEDRILIQDHEDTIYIYEQEFISDGSSHTRRGFIALNRLKKDRILIHEATRSKAKEDRERLISTLKTYTSFVFGLYEDMDNSIEDILANPERELIFDFMDESSIRNRFYRIRGKNNLKDLCALMEDKKIYIADGHHRLDVSYRLNLPYIPIYLTNMYSKGIVIWPYHRIIRFKKQRPFNEMINALGDYMTIEKIPATDEGSIKKALDIIASETLPSYAFYPREDMDNIYILKEKRPVVFREDIHEVLKRLKVNVLHSGMLNNILGIEEEEISFTQDPISYLEQLRRGSIDLMVLLPPTTVKEVKDIADNSLYMPPKSTFFYPKILTGPLFYKYG
ncbi:MAG TPA: DUF1015 domain-containing protein [Syntrophorhabdaceae bacterium]|nr:DUF1015 domain-containing protein [Syntrophorhabdaceae bacterium]HOT41063.1 DUF1015 domain-containing protein [Syntrophorhabdaceae bacterium]HPC66234.1 DUF1015 domain-containing protein [Syntrophorhabdaceae bacterium]HQE79089.1 DUF1015 domain-containing protein [Syntrophorhabdaceae bacterium]HQH42682.1 DUF1015 domain-containing protein [Syntrophorhabdaceae bacterium]